MKPTVIFFIGLATGILLTIGGILFFIMLLPLLTLL
jgi:hypothetical protein